ncbi:fructose-specific PTS transporter subunit EIIC [Streptomyces griseorubiginosus]|uniref:fructose-specific PTS transporter subunit EIIC n=1 Tax=Streptomyces griseorubiginosus TaxID=67304 RepID=UPI00365DD2BF
MSHPENRTTCTALPMDRDPISGNHLGDRSIVVRFGRWLAGSTHYAGALVAIGGLLTFLAYAVGGVEVAANAGTLLNDGPLTQADSWAALMIQTGASALLMLTPVVGGYVAYGIAGRQGILPGAIGGVVAMVSIGGFLGGITAGVLAGVTTAVARRISGRLAPRGTVSIALVPAVATAVTAAVIFELVGPRVSALVDALHNALPPLTWGSGTVLGLVLGLLVTADLSGAISKAAIAFAATGVQVAPNSLNFTIMATVMAAGMVPPMALSLATLVRGSVFTPAERSYGKVSWLFGAAFIPEGAVPFALADPLRVLPATLAGGAATGTLTMTFGSTMTSTIGGVFAIGHLGSPLLFAGAVAVGVLVTAGTVVGLKSLRRAVPAETDARAAIRRTTKVDAAIA